MNLLKRLAAALTAFATPSTPAPTPATEELRKVMRVSAEFLARASLQDDKERQDNEARVLESRQRTFAYAKPVKGVMPAEQEKQLKLAMDEGPWANAMAFATIGATFAEGLQFMGYPYLSELTQRPEYRRPAEIIAKEMTRKWIKLVAKGDEDKSDRIAELEEELKRLGVQKVFREVIEQDGFFGRAQIYIDIGVNTEDAAELRAPLLMSTAKIEKGALQRLIIVEPIWTYPNFYNAFDPLDKTFFKPQTWFIMGKEVHTSRLLTFVSREVPDMLKPSYAFGGLSLSQMLKPYVDNWLRTRQSVSDLLHAFSVFVLKTNFGDALNSGAGESLINRVLAFIRLRDNRGLFVVDKDTEEFDNVSAPLGSLDALQAQAQEHMSSVSGIPLVVYFGISPHGLNASSEGEIEVWRNWIAGQQEAITPNLSRIINIIQLSLWGDVDKDIGFIWVPLKTLSDKDIADLQKTKAETGQVLITAGVIDPTEERKRISEDEDTQYPGLDMNKTITPPDTGEEADAEHGLGGGPDAEGGAAAEKKPLAGDDFNEAMIERAPKGSHEGGQFVSKGKTTITGGGPGGGGSIPGYQHMSPGAKAAATKALKKTMQAEAEKSEAMKASILKANQANLAASEAWHKMTPGQKAAATKLANKQKQDAAQAKASTQAGPTESEFTKEAIEWSGKAGIDLGFAYYEAAVGESGSAAAIFKNGDAWVALVLDGPNQNMWASKGPIGQPKIGKGFDVLTALLKNKGQVPAGLKNKVGATTDDLLTELIGATPKTKEKIEAEKASMAAAAEAAKKEQEQISAGKDLFKKLTTHRPTPSPAQSNAIDSYKGSGYHDINKSLRFDHHPNDSAKKITDWLDEASIPEDCVLYRGIGKDAAPMLKSVLYPGGSIIDHGFMSMSTQESFSKGWGGGILMRITVPKGTKAATVRAPGMGDGESEVLAQRDSVLHITSFDFHAGIVECTMVQPGIIIQ